jgi:hypothetical protein
MKPKEERHCQFPICGHPNEFDAFFTGTKEKPNEERNALISHRVRESLRAAQPFYGLEMDKALGGDSERRLSYEDYARFHPLTVVSQLSNIYKHRRVTVAAWWPRIAFFTNDEDSKYEWKPLKWPPFEDGQIIVRMTGTGPEPSKVVHEFALVLPDSPNHPPVDYFASNYLPQEPEYWRLTVGGAMSTAIGQYRRLGQQEGQQTEPSTL